MTPEVSAALHAGLYTGIFLGVGIGMNIGLWLGSYLIKRWQKPLIEDYKKDVKYWFESSQKASKEAHEWYCKYLSLVIK